MNIALIAIATGKYDRFISPLFESARQFFLPGRETNYIVLSDKTLSPWDCRYLAHEPWPGPTLHRYRSMLEHVDLLDYDYVFYCDADMRFCDVVGDEILGSELTAVCHPGYYAKNVNSALPFARDGAFCIPPSREEANVYYAGGFQGGKSFAYAQAASMLARLIEEEELAGRVPRWHDESAWNWYLSHMPPAIRLDPGYCYPEGHDLPFVPRLLALNKNHAEMRSP